MRGGDAAEHRIVRRGAAQGCFIRQRAGIHKPLCARNACLRGNGTDGCGVIAGDDLDRDPLCREIRKGSGGILPQGIGEGDKQKRGGASRLKILRDLAGAKAKRKHALSARKRRGKLLCVGGNALSEQHLGRAEEIGAVREADCPVFLRGGKGHQRKRP